MSNKPSESFDELWRAGHDFAPREMTWTDGEYLYHYKQDIETTCEPLTDEVIARFDGIGMGGIVRQLRDDVKGTTGGSNHTDSKPGQSS